MLLADDMLWVDFTVFANKQTLSEFSWILPFGNYECDTYDEQSVYTR